MALWGQRILPAPAAHPLGNDHNSGNLNWLDIPGFPMEIQPNEIIKIPFILLLSLQITKIQDRGQSISSSPP